MSEADFSGSEQSAFRMLMKAVFSGCAVASLAIVVWNAFLIFALKDTALLGPAVATMGFILVLTAAYLQWGPSPTSGRAFRRQGLRFNAVQLRTIMLAAGAGWSTMLAGFLAYVSHRATAGLGGEVPIALPHLPFAELLPALLMGAFVAGSVEEVAFRGFMQGTLERRFGVVPAILISGLIWAAFHTNHSYFGEEAPLWIGIFLVVSAMLGTMAYRTNSVIPGIVVHTGFDAAYFLAAGFLQPAIAPIAFVQSLASPEVLLDAAAVAALAAVLFWFGFLRATGAPARDA